jgi:hypothetical protein
LKDLVFENEKTNKNFVMVLEGSIGSEPLHENTNSLNNINAFSTTANRKASLSNEISSINSLYG